MEPQRGGGIPKIIHQIWLGSNPRPDSWMKSVKDFAAKHGYKYMLWGEKNMKGLGIDSFEGLRKAYSAFRDQLAGKADIIRLLALYKYGGIYIDADSVIMKSQKFADFLDDNSASVFFGWENLSAAFTRKLGRIDPYIQRTRRMVANGLIGAKKGHPFIKRLLDGVGQSVAENSKEVKLEAWRALGPHYTTKLYNATRQEFPDVHVYPMKYFYPRHWHGISDPELHTKVKIPGQSMLFQYGYSTNKFNKIFSRKTRKRARTLDTNDEENGV